MAKQKVNHGKGTIDPQPKIDALVLSGTGGSLFVLDAITPAAQDWVSEHISTEGFNPDLPKRVYIEHRYISDIISAMRAAGLEVR